MELSLNCFTMIRLITLAFVLLSSAAAALSQYTISVAEHATDIVPGQTTYRIYVDVVNADDFLSSVYGNNEVPLNFSTTDGFYNDPLGSTVASGVNPLFYSFFPTIEADSWVTIGIDSQNEGDEIAINVVEDPTQPFLSAFQSGSAMDGQDFTIDSPSGGAWYVLNNTPNGLPDENMQVLMMQFTTSGEFSGQFNFQVFENGNGQSDIRTTVAFDGVGTFSEDNGDVDPVLGCTDVEACNYDGTATENDGSCAYLDALGECGGTCVADADSDGICDDEDDCIGQTDACGVCNGPGAIYECGCNDLPSGDCDCAGNGPVAGYDCEGNCLTDTDNDGVCDEFEVAGCTDAVACNYDAESTNDDGTCDYCSCAGDTDAANAYTMTVEVWGVDLEPGLTTYRIYQDMVNPDDFLSSVYGGEVAPLAIETTTGFYNSPLDRLSRVV